jgi:hypothetical protein
MDLLFACRRRRVERVYDHLTHGLLRGILRLTLAIPLLLRVVVLLIHDLKDSPHNFTAPDGAIQQRAIGAIL